MGIKKMSLANIAGKLSRAEMKNIMAGSTLDCYGPAPCRVGSCQGQCYVVGGYYCCAS